MTDYRTAAVEEAIAQGVDPHLILRQMAAESAGNPNARSPKGAQGLMQLMPGTARELGVDPNDPAQNLRGGVKYMKQQLDAFGGDPRLAAAAYNAGPGAVRKYGGVPPYAETEGYVAKVAAQPSDDPGYDPGVFGAPDATATANDPGYDIEVFGPDAPRPESGGIDLGDIDRSTHPDFLAGKSPDGEDRKHTFFGDIGDVMAGSVEKLKGDFTRQLAESSPTHPNNKPDPFGLGALELVGDVAGVALSPLTGVQHAITRPLAEGIASRVPVYDTSLFRDPFSAPRKLSKEEGAKKLQGDIGMALAAGMPVRGGVGLAGPQIPARLPKPGKAVPLASLKAQKTAAYNAVDAAGVRYTPAAADRLVASIKTDVTGANLNPARHPKAASMVEDIEKLAGQSPSLTELDQLRQVIRRDVASAPDAAEKHFGRRMIDMLDDFIEKATPSDVVSGSAADASALLKTARNLNARSRKVEAVEAALEKAKLQAGSTGSGGNIDNATRQKLRTVREKTPGLSPPEIAAFERAIVGTPGQNLLRTLGKLSPGGNGLMAALNVGSAGAGGAIGGPLGALAGATPGVIGIASKTGAEAMTKRNVDELLRILSTTGAAAPSAAAAAPAVDPKVIMLLDYLSQARSPPLTSLEAATRVAAQEAPRKEDKRQPNRAR